VFLDLANPFVTDRHSRPPIAIRGKGVSPGIVDSPMGYGDGRDGTIETHLARSIDRSIDVLRDG
jgi:hypothetical protein